MRQIKLFGITRRDIVGIQIYTVPKETYRTESMKGILESVNKAMKEYGFLDVTIVTKESVFTIAFNSGDGDIEIEEEREENGKYSSKYANTYSGEEETRRDFSPSKHTKAFFGFFGF